jgi:transcriptional accessory protein Tex/SPT6
MGLDPGFRTGVKIAVVDATGKVVATSVIYPHEPQRRWDEALAVLGKLAKQHNVELISIGNGTASRETDKLATELVKLLPDLKMTKIVVSEAGASVYSASAYASEELPDLTSHCAAQCRSHAGCRIRSPNWSRSIRNRSVSASTSMISANTNCPARSMPWLRIA